MLLPYSILAKRSSLIFLFIYVTINGVRGRLKTMEINAGDAGTMRALPSNSCQGSYASLDPLTF
jgi:hypothetical protein